MLKKSVTQTKEELDKIEELGSLDFWNNGLKDRIISFWESI